ncbi:MAG: hypothetical protein ACRDAU_10230 [Clostridium sp.]
MRREVFSINQNLELMKLLGTDILEMKGLNELSEEDGKIVIKLFTGYLNSCGCGNRQDIPISVEKLTKDKFKIYFSDGMFSYFYSDGSIG